MERESKYLLSILGDFLCGREPEKDAELDWKKLIQLAVIHNVVGILGYMTMRFSLCGDAEIAAQLRRDCKQTVLLFTQRAESAKTRLRQLADAGIPFVSMKGMLIRDCYPVPELRTFSDIDLLIHPEDRQKSHELFLSWGFQTKTDWEPVYSYFRGNEYYEIHTRIMEVDVSDKADYRGYFDRAWEYAKPVDGCRYEFTPEFHFIYLLTHIAKHVHGAGAGARMYLDIAAFLRHYEKTLDWAFVRRELEALYLWDFACTVLSAVAYWFGVTCPMEFRRADREVLDRFTVYTMEAGIFGHFQREAGVVSLKNGSGSRLAVLARRVFPKAETIESRYTYLQGRHYLLPVAWVHRWFKTNISLRNHAREAKTILTAEKATVDRLSIIRREIGL